MGVGEPAADGDGVLRVEDVRRGRVVDDDGFAEVAADLGEVLKQGNKKTMSESRDWFP